MGGCIRRLPSASAVIVFAALLGASCVWALSQPAAVAPVAPAHNPERLEPGLMLTFKSGDATDVRRARLITLLVPAGAAPTPLLPPGPFTATWSGNVTLRIRGEYTFSATGRGQLKVTVNDQVALDVSGDDLAAATADSKKVKLVRGRNKVLVEYTSPAEGDAALRLNWFERYPPPENISPMLLSHDAAEPSIVAASRLREGRQLVANLRCIKCHTTGSELPPDAMPELAMDAPNLNDAGARLNEPWMAQWISNPRSMRPDASMPKPFHGEQSEAQAADVAAYLATLGSGSDELEFDEAQAAAGGRIFTGLGCVSCHLPPDQDPAVVPAAQPARPAPAGANAAPVVPPPAPMPGATFTRIPLRYVKAKWQPAALVEFLKQPEKHYAWIRMPNFRLSDEEAAEVAAFLLSRAPADAVAPPASRGDPERGRALFTSAGCLSCHAGPGQNTLQVKPLETVLQGELKSGCLATDEAHRGDAPDFRITPEHHEAIAAFATSEQAGIKSLLRDELSEAAERQIGVLNCVACHTRDRQEDTWSTLSSEIAAIEGSLPPAPPPEDGEHPQYAPDQHRPQLTWLGEKLKPQWAGEFIAGQIPYKPRPWIRARMPGFPARAQVLARGMALQHGCPPVAPPEPAPDPELADIGRKLTGRDGGFSCVQCHAVADQPATAAFEAPAPNFMYVKERITKPYYHWWMRNPIRIEPGTRMPQFADVEGKTALKNVFDGDATKQFEAIWQYLLAGESITPP